VSQEDIINPRGSPNQNPEEPTTGHRIKTVNGEHFAERASKTEVYVSFDGKDKSHNSVSLQQQFSENESLIDEICPINPKAHMRNNSTHQIISILDKIIDKQQNRTSFYDSYIPKDDEGAR
jgi:hypothetical protein